MMTIKGQVLGVKVEDRTNKQTGEVFETYSVGIQTPKENGYDGEMITNDIKISAAQKKAGLQATYEKHRGQVVTAPIFVTAWAGKNGRAGLNYHFSGDGSPVAVAKQ